ncbi:MAG: DMT family transporter [Rhodospirillales bacterium]|nr:DMT family transporter [Rhodospirillales bacterium]
MIRNRDRSTRDPMVSASLLLSIAVLCWAGNFVLGRAIHADIPPIGLTFWRWFVAGLVLLPLAGVDLWRHRAAFVRSWRLVLVLAASGICLFHICVYTALRTTTATNAALLVATTPVVIPVMSYLIYRTVVSARQAMGIALSLVGVTAIIIKGDLATISALRLVEGDLWMLLAVPTWALYSVLLRHVPDDWPRLAMILAITACGLVLLTPLYVWELAAVGAMALSVDNALAVAYVALFASVIAYIGWNRGVALIGANKAGLFMHLMPVFATALAVLLLGENLHFYHGVGVSLIVLGIVLTTMNGPRSNGA